ncbi:BgTH12-03686 [Blumeria graminis f. sp. triticale]|uniref:BgTH12-03686 n=1 Tax=Blumeria graminis f. sp. triticale TaxID=1689686 RepID=A0A9W4D1G3_BLUGR|nr:BgTH12-03686 [Blumeria graminis f. sp. triticale]
MNDINIGVLNAMSGGPINSGMPMMNNCAPGGRPLMPINNDQRSQLNTYIYEYFLRNGMYECAKALLESGQPLNVIKDGSSRRRDDNGAGEEAGEDSKDDFDPKRPIDLPDPNVPKECSESCFLYEWWCLFWDMFNAQRGKAEGRNVLQYFTHTQAQSRSKQEQQQMMLRGLRNDMSYSQGFNPLRNPQNLGMAVNPQHELRQIALQNNRNATPAHIQMMQQQHQKQQQQQQQQLQRDPSVNENQPRPQSPTADNAPSPSKRPRLDGANFNSQSQMPNGRAQGGAKPQQFQNMQGAPAVAAQRLAGYQASLGQQQQSQMPNVKAIPNSTGSQGRASPMMAQGQQDGNSIANYYNTGEVGPNGIRGVPGGQPVNGGNHALQDYQMQLMLLEQQNKKRLMMARQEQDNMMPRPEGGQGLPGAGPNGQSFQGTSPQGNRSANSPNPGEQLKRTPHMNSAGMPSPLPEGQTRGSPSSSLNFNLPGAQMDPGMSSQYFAKGNSMDPNLVGSVPNAMRPPSSHPNNFNQMTPQAQMALAARQQQVQQQQQAQQQHAQQQHAQQQHAHQQHAQQQQAHQQQAQQQQAQQQAQHQAQQQAQQQQQNWQPGPNGQPMMAQPPQGQAGSQQTIGTPQQRNMPPPSMTAAGVTTNTNGRTPQATVSPGQTPAPPTPQQANKANPKKKAETKDNKLKRAQKKGSAANLNAGATPSADAEATGATPTPATPMTPVHKQSFNGNQNGTVQPASNGQATNQSNNIGMAQQPDPLQGGGFGLADSAFPNFDTSLDFANPGNGNMDVLQDFDFDSFLHQDAGDAVNDFNFDTSGFLDGNEIGAD